MPRPDLARVPEWFHRYIARVEEDDLMAAFHNQSASFIAFMKSLPVEKREYRYAEDKWTVKEMLQHITDAERIFGYRTLCFARKDSTPLPGFDENAYALHARASDRDWDELLEEFSALRKANELMFRGFNGDQLESEGTASGKKIYVLGMGFVIVGHVAHHLHVLQERYLS